MFEENIYKEKDWNYYLLVLPIMIFFITFITWATLSEIDEIVRGDGTVIPSGKTRVIGHLEGGIIENIFVLCHQEFLRCQ